MGSDWVGNSERWSAILHRPAVLICCVYQVSLCNVNLTDPSSLKMWRGRGEELLIVIVGETN